MLLHSDIFCPHMFCTVPCKMAASMKVSKILKFSMKPLQYVCKRHRMWPTTQLTGYYTHKDPAVRESHPWDAKTFEERMAERTPMDPVAAVKPNIGEDVKTRRYSRKELIEIQRSKQNNPALEKAARLRTLKVPIAEVEEEWETEHGIKQQYDLAQHFAIYDHLFNGAYFYPTVQLRVFYEMEGAEEGKREGDLVEKWVNPVYRGNKLTPRQTSSVPHVVYEAEEDSLWTLVLSNPDGHLTDNNSEYLHWMIGNIPGNDLSNGEVLCDYLQPFPVKGTGYHRMVFVLYRQDGRVDYTPQQRPENCTNLSERTFSSAEFYRQYSSQLTPVGLSFFQAQWDTSVIDTFQHVLDMPQPIFEYDHPLPYHPPQQRYPRRQAFDRYIDTYRDKKDLAEEVLRLKLSMISPFKPYVPEKFPLVHRDKKYKPDWLRNKEEMMHRRLEQFKDLP